MERAIPLLPEIWVRIVARTDSILIDNEGRDHMAWLLAMTCQTLCNLFRPVLAPAHYLRWWKWFGAYEDACSWPSEPGIPSRRHNALEGALANGRLSQFMWLWRRSPGAIYHTPWTIFELALECKQYKILEWLLDQDFAKKPIMAYDAGVFLCELLDYPPQIFRFIEPGAVISRLYSLCCPKGLTVSLHSFNAILAKMKQEADILLVDQFLESHPLGTVRSPDELKFCALASGSPTATKWAYQRDKTSKAKHDDPSEILRLEQASLKHPMMPSYAIPRRRWDLIVPHVNTHARNMMETAVESGYTAQELEKLAEVLTGRPSPTKVRFGSAWSATLIWAAAKRGDRTLLAFLRTRYLEKAWEVERTERLLNCYFLYRMD
jgi:hypothetical protein